jgi:hypothetical protein
MRGEYDFEPVPGLPENLPVGETLLWQGAPNWKNLAIRALHIRGTAIYFTLLLIWYTETKLTQGESWSSVLMSDLRLGGLAAVTLSLMGVFAWMSAKTTLYTITSRRVVMRAGVALPIILNLPFSKIEAANLKDYADGSGDIALTLPPTDRVAYLTLWPHVRPWRFNRAEPMLRGLPNAATVATLLAEVLAAETGSAATASQAERQPAVPKLIRRPQAAALA